MLWALRSKAFQVQGMRLRPSAGDSVRGLMCKVWGELLLRSLDLRRGTHLGVDCYGFSRP